MALPRIDTPAAGFGFGWRTPDGRPARLVELFALPGAEPGRWLATHAEALDEVLIEVAARFGEILGGARGPGLGEHDDVAAAYRAIDRAVLEYAEAQREAGLPGDLRAGQIIGTAALLGIRLRWSLGMTGPAPFDGELDTPGVGVIDGRAGLHWVDRDVPWRGARWLVHTTDGRRLPATLSMLRHDSSGVDTAAALTEHREALASVCRAALGPHVEPMQACGAVDWLLFDWVMAHRDSGDSGAVVIAAGRVGDARMIMRAADVSARVRARFDPNLSGRG